MVTLDVPHVAVLLCTYHGERYLPEQLDSLLAQDYPNFSVWVSDDSEDQETRSIVERYKTKKPGLIQAIRKGPGKGSSENFLALLASEEIQADYFAFCDQDDVWNTDKLSRAVAALFVQNQETPLLYCSRVSLIDQDGSFLGLSPLFRKPPSFANALVQSLAGGNTMVLNRAARELIKTARRGDVVVHDWWVYLLVTGAGGLVIYDPKPTLLYRQHSQNVIGCDQSFLARLSRLRALLGRQHQRWHDINVRALDENVESLTPENRELLAEFHACRNGGLVTRLRKVFGFPFCRQTWMGTCSLYLAFLLKRL